MFIVGRVRKGASDIIDVAILVCDMMKTGSRRSQVVRSRLSAGLLVLLLLQSMSAYAFDSVPISGNIVLVENPAEAGARDAWNETPFRDIAVLEPFSHQSLSDYSDVAVIINNRSTESRTIGYAFAVARNIPPERVLLLTNESTPTAETINPEQFDDYFAAPILEMLQQRNLTELNVLVTTMGVPLRVNGGTNARAAFDSEIALIGGPLSAYIHANWWIDSDYGPAADNEMEKFSRADQGYYLVTRLTGYDVETALALIEKANNSLGQRGLSVLDLATNRNGSGYKYWNDYLYTTDSNLNAMGLPVHFNQNSTFITDMDDVMMYASWGSNDGSWNSNYLPNSGFDTADVAWSTGAENWQGVDPQLSPGEQWWWTRTTETTRNGNGAIEGRLDSAPCATAAAENTNGLLAEYFDNNGVSYNSSLMPDLTGRTVDFSRHEANIDWAVTGGIWAGLDNRFSDYWSVRHTGILHIPTAGNWTFYLDSDDGAKLWIDGVEVVDNQGVHGMREISNTTWLAAGEHHLRTEFFEHGGHAGLHLKWQGPGVSKQVIPTTALTRGSSDPVRGSDLIHHWTFDHSSGDVATDSVGTADLNFTGTNGGQWRGCVLGNCAIFDGVNDFAKVDVNDSVTDFTVSLWVQANHTGQSRYSSVIAVNDVAGDDESFQIMTSGGSPGDWEVYHNVSYGFGAVDPTYWQHLVVTFSNDTVYQYLDGVEVRVTPVPNGTINSIELYKFGVNRAGNTYYTGAIDEVQIWDAALSEEEVADVHDEIIWICPSFNSTGTPTAHVEQVWDFGAELQGHAWILYGYSMTEGWLEGDWWLEIESLDANGSTLSVNQSDSRAFSDDWQSRTVRFRPHENATQFIVRQVAELQDGTYNGSVFFDTLNLRAIRPHFTWIDGSIAETAVSTGGRSFSWGTSYGQSLVVDLLEDGTSGVKGYVYEPYLGAISDPSILLPVYASGYTMSESYAASNVLLSWMGTVVGDPKMAPYADLLHDVNVSEVRAPDRLSIGVTGTLEVLLENLAPAQAHGSLVVQQRTNAEVIATVPLVIPGGNDAGSRLILSVNVTPTRSDYVEFVVVWIPTDDNSERTYENNFATLNHRVNTAPSIDSISCSTLTPFRGGVLTCTVEASDEFGVTSAEWYWSASDATTVINTVTGYSTDGGQTWRFSISFPENISLGNVSTSVTVWDEQGLFFSIDGPTLVIHDAVATWFGPHVAGVDVEPWGGTSQTADSATGFVRGRMHVVTTCVLDLDHDVNSQSPHIEVDGVALPDTALVSYSGGQACYATTWTPLAGTPLDDVKMTLAEGGQLIRERLLTPIDLPPTVELSIREVGSGEVRHHLKGHQDGMFVLLLDEDDPTEFPGLELRIEWPGSGPQSMMVDGRSDVTGLSSITAGPGLEQGEATVTARITEGSWVNMTWQWTFSVIITPPQLSEPVVCATDASSDEVVRGEAATVWVSTQAGRSIDRGQVILERNSNSISTVVSVVVGIPPARCTPSSNPGDIHLRLDLTADWIERSFPLGTSELSVVLTDIDGLSGSSTVSIEVEGAKPSLDLSALPLAVVGGKGQLLIIGIEDADGFAGTVCDILLIDDDGLTRISDSWVPDETGVHFVEWQPPKIDLSPYYLEVGCLDGDGHAVGAEWSFSHNEAPSENETDEGEGEDDLSVSKGLAIGSAALVVLLVIIIGTTALLISLRRGEPEQEMFDDELPVDAWSQSAGEISDEIIAEMAGIDAPAEGPSTENEKVLDILEAEVEPEENTDEEVDVLLTVEAVEVDDVEEPSDDTSESE